MIIIYSVIDREARVFIGGQRLEGVGRIPSDPSEFRFNRFSASDCVWIVPGTMQP